MQDVEVNLLKIANTHFRNGDYEKAINLYRPGVGNSEKIDLYRQNLILALQAANFLKEASQEIYRGLAEKPKDRVLKSFLEHQNRNQVKNHNGPTLSVIVPVYNSDKYLEKCLRSILDQKFEDLELLIVNDGSTDNCNEIIRKFEMQDTRIKVIYNEKPSGNPGTPRNQALAIAEGAYIGFVDSDDWIEPDYYQTLLDEALSSYSDIVFSGGFNNHSIDEIEVRKYPASEFGNPDSPLYKYHESFMIWDKIFNKKMIDGFEIRLGETKAAVDVPFIFKAYYYANRVSFCEGYIGYNYRRESDSSVTVSQRKKSDCKFELEAFEDIISWAKYNDISSFYCDLIRLKQINSLIYTLSLIDKRFYFDFYNKAQSLAKKLSVNQVKDHYERLGKNHIVNRFKSLISIDAQAYMEEYRTSKENGEELLHKREFFIEGSSKGIIFFPDWVHRNPYLKLFYSALSSECNVRVSGFNKKYLNEDLLASACDNYEYLHLHWLHNYIDVDDPDGADELISTLRFAKNLGYKLVYTAHNVVSHESSDRNNEIALRRKVLPLFDLIIAHGNVAKNRLTSELGVEKEKITVITHGGYQGYYKNFLSKPVARKRLEINDGDFVFLFFGNIRGYKGVDPLINAFEKISLNNKNVKLIIAGNTTDKLVEQKIRNFESNNSSVIYHHGFISEDDVQLYMNACDMSILPYTKILTSGAALLSLSFNRPVIAPKSGVLPEIIDSKIGDLFDSFEDMTLLMQHAVNDKRDGKWSKRFKDSHFNEFKQGVEWSKVIKESGLRDQFKESNIENGEESNPKFPFKYAILRIIGNDLPFRHSENQTLVNLQFTLDNENDFSGTKKIWVLNRIIDRNKKLKIIKMLDDHGYDYVDIPFESEVYIKEPFAFEELPRHDFKFTDVFSKYDERNKVIVDTAILKHKNNYVMNNNGARNTALEEGRKIAEWVFPWDGNCFISDSAWELITNGIESCKDKKYHIVPMDRGLDNNSVLNSDYIPNAVEEPQVIFRHDAGCRFDETLMYGLKPKVDFLKRLGVPGIWDKWNKLYPWKAHEIKQEAERYNYAWSGWVLRLFSGNEGSELSAYERAVNREKGICSYLEDLHIECSGFQKNILKIKAEVVNETDSNSLYTSEEKILLERSKELYGAKEELIEKIKSRNSLKEEDIIAFGLFVDLLTSSADRILNEGDRSFTVSFVMMLRGTADLIFVPLRKLCSKSHEELKSKFFLLISELLDSLSNSAIANEVHNNAREVSFILERELYLAAASIGDAKTAYSLLLSVQSRINSFVTSSITDRKASDIDSSTLYSVAYASVFDLSKVAKLTLKIDLLSYENLIFGKKGNPLKVGLKRFLDKQLALADVESIHFEIAKSTYNSTAKYVPFVQKELYGKFSKSET